MPVLSGEEAKHGGAGNVKWESVRTRKGPKTEENRRREGKVNCFALCCTLLYTLCHKIFCRANSGVESSEEATHVALPGEESSEDATQIALPGFRGRVGPILGGTLVMNLILPELRTTWRYGLKETPYYEARTSEDQRFKKGPGESMSVLRERIKGGVKGIDDMFARVTLDDLHHITIMNGHALLALRTYLEVGRFNPWFVVLTGHSVSSGIERFKSTIDQVLVRAQETANLLSPEYRKMFHDKFIGQQNSHLLRYKTTEMTQYVFEGVVVISMLLTYHVLSTAEEPDEERSDSWRFFLAAAIFGVVCSIIGGCVRLAYVNTAYECTRTRIVLFSAFIIFTFALAAPFALKHCGVPFSDISHFFFVLPLMSSNTFSLLRELRTYYSSVQSMMWILDAADAMNTHIEIVKAKEEETLGKVD